MTELFNVDEAKLKGEKTMMGYTHEAIGAGGALAASIVLSSGKPTPDIFIVAAFSGIIGGIMVDADVVDTRSRIKLLMEADHV